MELEQQVCKILENISVMKETLVRNTCSLEEHMRRTEIIEVELKNIKEKEINCPGKMYALRKASTLETIRDIGVLLGVIVVIMQLLGIIK